MATGTTFTASDFTQLYDSPVGNPYLSFEILETTTSGEVRFIKDARTDLSPQPSTLFPAGSPPFIPTLEDEVKERFLSSVDHLPIHDFRNTQVLWEREKDLHSLLIMDVSPLTTDIHVERDPMTGELVDFYEADAIGVKRSGAMTSKNSCSLNRAPGPLSEATKGSSTNFPFWPGGFDEPNIDHLMQNVEIEKIDFQNDLLTCPPGFDHGMKFEDSKTSINAGVIKLEDLLEPGLDELWEESESSTKKAENNKETKPEIVRSESLENLIEQSNAFTITSKTSASDRTASDEFAIMMEVNKPIPDFKKKVPKLAHQYPFELDIFQKQAVICLEEGKNVFVAAHTSAGKTVVAEYAIAMAKHHMTRVVYTSPIKALSNQKYRDFKHTFEDVGLLTGDVQIHPEAFCLIMTTEILRSMLYNGSEVVRDLEWVIFDEVHYINDAERGVVWEEVLIMLPDHCNVILLSATVSNTVEFANWVGRTKRKNIYVVSTSKRPVPLEHYLYTGNSNKTSNEMFLLLDHKRQFHTNAHVKAVEAKKERMSKHQKTYGAKHTKSTPASDKGVWLSLIERLRKKDQLPVVAFTFSRRRCDDNANALTSLDLTTSAEKSEIHVFFNKCIQKLKGDDKRLPQVLQMATLLHRGVAVHHSGILPILKEVIEMLFGRGLVKLLFATETFAMGVNMPARTVVFDSIRKHDGTTMRDLLPGEYIQMAGRAGRRGLDATGNVILLCKGDVPEISDLHNMMLGRPTKLESQFRITYTMILNLLRVEQVRLEDMMKRSFSEFHQRKNSNAQESRVKELDRLLENMNETRELVESGYGAYYEKCEELIRIRSALMREALLSNTGLKVMQSGRVIVINTNEYRLSLAVVLKTSMGKEKTYSVLVLCDDPDQQGQLFPHELTPQCILHQILNRPEVPTHRVTEISTGDICYITSITCPVKSERILDDYKKRQIPRFQHDPPGESTIFATQELMRLVEQHPHTLPSLDPVSDFHLNQLDIVEDARRCQFLEESIAIAYSTLDSIRFNSVMSDVEKYMKTRKESEKIKYLLSEESLHLLPEYKQRVEVLKDLQYVDQNSAVQLKGRVACEISNNELVLTELVFNNMLTPLEPCEIVALLSCVVFQQRIDMSEVKLPKKLQDGMDEIIVIATSIAEKQQQFGLKQPVEDFVGELKFGLTLAVHEWAKGTSFQDITGLTEVQEGIIVRTIQRLNETCRDIRNAAKVIGDPILYQKMEKCSELIKRDIVFAASLYTQ